jgi:hypothetical protein
MRTIAILPFLCLTAAAAEIPQGTHLLLRMVNSINTRTADEGDQVYLRTASPVAIDGHILVPEGSYVQGTISRTRRSGKVAGRAELAIRLESLTLPNGRSLKVSPRLSSVDSNQTGQKVERDENIIKQSSDYGSDAPRIAILAGSGAGIGGIADRSWPAAGIGAGAGGAVGFASTLLTRGKDVELRQGSTLDIVFDRPIVVE